MTFEAIMQEIVNWDSDELRKLQMLIVSLRQRHAERDLAEDREAWLRRLSELRERGTPADAIIQQMMDDLSAERLE